MTRSSVPLLVSRRDDAHVFWAGAVVRRTGDGADLVEASGVCNPVEDAVEELS